MTPSSATLCNRLRPELVGAAGFEPATCSTQNCRATRLRYAPEPRERRLPPRYTVRFFPASAGRTARGHAGFRQGRGVRHDPLDDAVAADEDHVQRNVRILHPELEALVAAE